MTKTNKEIILFLNFATSYVDQNKPDSKFKYAVQRMQKRCAKLYETYQEEIEDSNIKFCAVDKDGVIKKDPKGGYEFKKEDFVAMKKVQRELLNSDVEIEPYFATEPPPDPLTFEEVEICVGFVLKDEESKLEVVNAN